MFAEATKANRAANIATPTVINHKSSIVARATCDNRHATLKVVS